MAKKGECPTLAACICRFFFQVSTRVIRPVWRDLFFTEIPATVEVARELCRLGDALYWRYKLVEILTKNYTTVAKVKWGPTRAKWRSSCVKFKPSVRRDAPQAAKWWSRWDKWSWRCWIWTDRVELGCSYWTEWEDWSRSTGTSQRKWRENLRINTPDAVKHVDAPGSRAIIYHPLMHKNGVCHLETWI